MLKSSLDTLWKDAKPPERTNVAAKVLPILSVRAATSSMNCLSIQKISIFALNVICHCFVPKRIKEVSNVFDVYTGQLYLMASGAESLIVQPQQKWLSDAAIMLCDAETSEDLKELTIC